MEIGKVTPLQEASLTALDRLWHDIMMADIKKHSKKLDKKIFDKPKRVKYKCKECTSHCTFTSRPIPIPTSCLYADAQIKAKWVAV